MGIIFSFLLKILTIFRLLLGGFLALPDSQPPNIQSTLFEILTSDSIQGNASDICYCFYCIIKKWLKLSQKTGSLAHFESFSITPSYTLISYTPQSSAKLNILCYGMGGIYIILVNHQFSICSQLSSYKFSNLLDCRLRETQLPFLKLLMPPRLKTEPCVTCFLFFLSSKVQM